ncbi:GNAT family N-acetyltransferase [Streptomyces peucetius]|uniref:GNAT family N-acetyltransferase n=1 Tax=Streptomyces peucetius TaxID=1950 RepID=A0ABY6I445_STRPE|nr:GNAT family N-acetyltransferase [Streptomyces peucetius]UYQ61754.1 GNAT family N-acetyltransferase [Streptomyces peucetius]
MIADSAIRPATASDSDVETLVSLYDGAARWMLRHRIDQWKPGDKDAAHFRHRMTEGEVWLLQLGGRTAGAYEMWWDDVPAWGVQPPVAGYVHRLMTARGADAPPGAGRVLLAHAERRIAAAGRELARLDCLSRNPRLRAYYEAAGYRVVGEEPAKVAADGSSYGVLLLEKRLARSASTPTPPPMTPGGQPPT